MNRMVYRAMAFAFLAAACMLPYGTAARAQLPTTIPGPWGAEADGRMSNGPDGITLAARLVNSWDDKSGLAKATECQRELQRYTFTQTPGVETAGLLTMSIRATWLLEPQQTPEGLIQPFVDIGTTVAVPVVLVSDPSVTYTTDYRVDQKLTARTHGGEAAGSPSVESDPAAAGAFKPTTASVLDTVARGKDKGIGPVTRFKQRIYIAGSDIFMEEDTAPAFDCTTPPDWWALFDPSGDMLDSGGLNPGELNVTPTKTGFEATFARDLSYPITLTQPTQSFILGLDRRMALVTVAVPEPSSLSFLATGGFGLLGFGWRLRRKKA